MIQRIPLKDLCSIDITDGTHKTPTYADSGYIFLSSKNVTSGEIDWDNVMYIPEELHKELYQRLAPQKDDILLAKNGTTGVAALVDREEIFDIYVSLALIRPDKNKIIPKYLLYAINSESSKRYFDSHLKGVGVPNLHLTHIRETPISVPDFHTQEEIIKRLDKVSDLIAKRRQQLDKLDLLVKARFVEMFGDPVSNPKQWETFSFDQAFDITSSKRILKSEWKASGIPFLRVRDMVQLATTGTMENEFFVSEEFYTSLKDSDGLPKEGDILISATSTLGKCYIVQHGERFYFKDADVLRFRAKIEINPIYFVELMDTQYIKEQIKRTLGVTTVSHFTIVAAKRINLRCPDIDLQNQFALFVKQIENTKIVIKDSLEKLEILKKALMQEYFG